jgi:DNA-binding response OmpR family regulator
MVVMLTSRGSPIDKLRGTMAGCDAYLTKPLDESELLKVISLKPQPSAARTQLNPLELQK